MVEDCGDLALKSFVAARCVSHKLHQKEIEAPSSSELAALQARVTELGNQLASEKERNELFADKVKADEEVAKARDSAKAFRIELDNTASSCDSMKKDIEMLTRDVFEKNIALCKIQK